MSVIDLDLNRVLSAAGETPSQDTRVSTTTLLPGGGLATVSIRAAGEAFVVSDAGAAREAMLALGLHDLTRGDLRRAHEIAEARGLSFQDGAFSLTAVSADQMGAAISYIADASRALVAEALAARARRQERDLVSRTVDRLRAIFPNAQLDTERDLLGASTKRHRFDLVMTLPADRMAVFQTVSPAAASIASVHLKLFDLAQAQPDWPREAIVDDLAAWTSDDLAIMQQVSTHLRDFTGSWADLPELLTVGRREGSTFPLNFSLPAPSKRLN